MYFFHLHQLYVYSNSRVYYSIFTKHNDYLVINVFIYVTCNNLIHSMDINNIISCQRSLFNSSIIFLFSIIFLLVFKYMIYMEVNTFNIRALSLYLWLGSQVVCKRNNYYITHISLFCQYSYSAYSLVINNAYGKNILRRYLLL